MLQDVAIFTCSFLLHSLWPQWVPQAIKGISLTWFLAFQVLFLQPLGAISKSDFNYNISNTLLLGSSIVFATDMEVKCQWGCIFLLAERIWTRVIFRELTLSPPFDFFSFCIRLKNLISWAKIHLRVRLHTLSARYSRFSSDRTLPWDYHSAQVT